MLDARSLALRRKVVETMIAGGRGHLPSALSLVEILRVLYDEVLRLDPVRPDWPLRDRCVLSKGHGCLALYALLQDKGFFPEEVLSTFCRPGSLLGGHPERGKVPGVEASTGSLGHGLPIGLGYALAGRLSHADYRTCVILGDGECDEGSTWEAAMIAAKHRLDSLVVIVDYNKQQSYAGTSEVLPLEPFSDKWRAFGFAVAEVDGHDVRALRQTFQTLPLAAGRPSAVICHTVKGKGIDFLEGDLAWHHKSALNSATVDQLFAALKG